MPVIESVRARQILDCKARPMVEVEVRTSNGATGRGSAPTGTSVGAHEAFILRDNDPDHYQGHGVQRAVANVNELIEPLLRGRPVHDQAGIDDAMIGLDGTADKSRLGGNAVYATSVAVLRAAAAEAQVPVYRLLHPEPLHELPVPCYNMINGGSYADVTQPFNEFLVLPYRAATIDEAVEIAVVLFGVLAEELTRQIGQPPLIASSYGYAAPSEDPRRILELMYAAVERAGLLDTVGFALDCASSEMYDKATQTYLLNGRRVDADALIGFAHQLSVDYGLVFIEDLLDQDDWPAWQHARDVITGSLLIGDDLTVTDVHRLQRAIDLGCLDGFVLKPNQVGTITEALRAHALAQANGLYTVPSGRSGGAIDDIVIDLSVALQAPLQKNGAPRSGERIEKLNFLLRTADEVPGRRLCDRLRARQVPPNPCTLERAADIERGAHQNASETPENGLQEPDRA